MHGINNSGQPGGHAYRISEYTCVLFGFIAAAKTTLSLIPKLGDQLGIACAAAGIACLVFAALGGIQTRRLLNKILVDGRLGADFHSSDPLVQLLFVERARWLLTAISAFAFVLSLA